MLGIKNIKIQMYVGFIGAAIVFMTALAVFDTAKNTLEAVIIIGQEMHEM